MIYSEKKKLHSKLKTILYVMILLFCPDEILVVAYVAHFPQLYLISQDYSNCLRSITFT